MHDDLTHQGAKHSQINQLGYHLFGGANFNANCGSDFGANQQSADQGDAGAQSNLGILYANGLGVSKDYAEALKWFRLAADQGSENAQFRLGLMYRNGEGVTQDYAEAVKWYRLAADQGYAVAQSTLGYLYANGLGVPQDYAEAYVWSNLAASGGNEGALQNRDLAASLLSPEALIAAQKRTAKLFEEINARENE